MKWPFRGEHEKSFDVITVALVVSLASCRWYAER